MSESEISNCCLLLDGRQMISALVATIKKGDLSLFQQLLNDAGTLYDINKRGLDGMCAQHWAAKLGQIDMLKLLLGKIDLGKTDRSGRTALFHAIENDTKAPEVIDFLLQNGANPMHYDQAGKTALWLAAETGNPYAVRRLVGLDKTTLLDIVRSCEKHHNAQSITVKSVQTLLDCDADINARTENGDTVLHIVAGNGCIAVFDLLTSFPQLVEAKNSAKYTPLHVAAENGSENVARALVDQCSAKIEAKTERNWTPLHLAARHGKSQLASFLMDKGADCMAETATGYTPVYLSCFNGHDELAIILLDRMTKEQAFAVTNAHDDSLLFVAVRYGCFRVVKRLVQYSQEDSRGELLSEQINDCTPVLLALAEKHNNIAKFLIEQGASTEGTDADGNTALHLASMHGMPDILASLLESHEDANQLLARLNHEQMTPLQCAAAGLHTDVVQILLKHSDPQRIAKQDINGWTALHWATWYERLDLIKLIINRGAELSVKDASNRTAFDLANELRNKPIEVLEWLTLHDLHNVHTPNPPLTKPVPEAEVKDRYKKTSIYLMNVYPQAEMEKSKFTIFDVVYEWGPAPFMTMVAKAQRIQEHPSFRWIHLPMNDVSVPAVQF